MEDKKPRKKKCKSKIRVAKTFDDITAKGIKFKSIKKVSLLSKFVKGKNYILEKNLKSKTRKILEELAKEGKITRYMSSYGIAYLEEDLNSIFEKELDKIKEIEKNLTKEKITPLNFAEPIHLDELDPAFELWFVPYTHKRKSDLQYHKYLSKDGMYYVDIRHQIAKHIRIIAQKLGCSQIEIFKQLEPIMQSQLELRIRQIDRQNKKLKKLNLTKEDDVNE